MGGGGKSGQTVGYRYYMSIQMGLCRGPIDEIVQINVGDVRAWPIPDGDSETESGLALIAEGPNGNGIPLYENGDSSVTSPSQINTVRSSTITTINAPNLFGGDKKEGGIDGALWVYMGEKTQIYSSGQKGWLGGLVPDFRGVVTLFFDGLICSLNPYPKAWKVRVRRVLGGWDGPPWRPNLAVIWMRNGTIKAMNGAHIVYECLTNRDWGRGFDRSVIDDAAMTAVAQKLYNEGLGLCLRWNRQDELGDFIQEVIDHVGGSLYLDRTTGLLTMSLLRGDYDTNTLPTFSYDSGLISVEDDETNSRDDLVNETIVNWHDPLKNQDRQARLHNLASMQSTGALKSTTTTYSGVPTVDLALRLGQRDIKANATALKRYKVILDRRAWKLIPGSVFKISAPDRNIFSVILRAGKVSEAQAPDGRITVEAMIDVFGLPAASFISGQDPVWEAPDRTAVIIANRLVREATYGDMVQNLSPADLALVDPTSGALAIVAGKPTTLSQSFGIVSRVGAEEFERRNSGFFVPIARVATNVNIYDSQIQFVGGSELGVVEIGTLVQIGQEICRLDDITTEDGVGGVITLGRACVDTLPQAHAPGDVIYFADSSFSSDGREYVDGETVDVKLTTVTSTQELPIALAEIDSVAITGRQGRPWPPGDLRVNGVPYGSAPGQIGDVVFTWAHRDRTLIQDQLVDHQGGSVGPEVGTSYNVRVYRQGNATPIRAVTGITGTGWTYTASMSSSDAIGDIASFEVESVRDGITSNFKYAFDLIYLSRPSALVSFTATGPSFANLSASTAVASNTAFIQFYRTVHGVALNTSTDKIGPERPTASSSTLNVTDTPGAGNWDYYAEPISAEHVRGPMRGPVNLVLT